jgi:signal recognition particle subunit SRP54
MFDSLADRLGEVFEHLTKRGALTESDVGKALREVRIALLEADVALSVVKKFIDQVKERAVGAEVLNSITPGQMVIKVVHDHLVQMLGSDLVPVTLGANPPGVVMLVGLQGSGKTTTAAKLGLRFKTRDHKNTLMASLDVNRPAAQEQLLLLGRQAAVDTLPVVQGQLPLAIAERAVQAARLGGYDALILDTAGRLHINDALMNELTELVDVTQPIETLLVADSLTGQDAVKIADGFHRRVGLTGLVLTRVDGDGRGGAALSVRSVTGCPIKLIGVGENLEALEDFHPERIASRLLGMGDVVSLVEKAQATIEHDEAEKLAAKLGKGQFDFEDLAVQIAQIRKMGGMEGMLALLPGIAKIKKKMAVGRVDERQLSHQEAIIRSMTLNERRNAKLLNSSRKRRIASGSGTTIQEVNRLLKQQKDMSTMMKRATKMGKKGLMPSALPNVLPPGFPTP